MLLGIGRHRGEASVERASLRGVGPDGDRRGEQRMGEAQPLAVQLHDPGLQCVAEARRGVFVDRRLDEAHGRLGERGHDTRNRERLRAQAVEALVHERVEVGRDRQLLARDHPAAPALERSPELEREERVPSRRLPDAPERRTEQTLAESRPQELVERAEGQSAELERKQALLRQRAAGARAVPPRGR